MMEINEGKMSREFQFIIETICKLVVEREPATISIFVTATGCEPYDSGKPQEGEMVTLSWPGVETPSKNGATAFRPGDKLPDMERALAALNEIARYQCELIWGTPRARSTPRTPGIQDAS